MGTTGSKAGAWAGRARRHLIAQFLAMRIPAFLPSPTPMETRVRPGGVQLACRSQAARTYMSEVTLNQPRFSTLGLPQYSYLKVDLEVAPPHLNTSITHLSTITTRINHHRYQPLASYST